MRIYVIGSGGARYVMMTQMRRTGGLVLEKDNQLIYIDPGPGALIYGRKYVNLRKVTALLVSHAHLDHSNDANLLIESMTDAGARKRGVLIGSQSVIEGTEDATPIITKYHRSMLERTVVAGDRTHVEWNNVRVVTYPMQHTDPTCIGFVLSLGEYRVGYISDTEFFEELITVFENMDLLIVCTLRPSGKRIRGHITTDDLIAIARGCKPRNILMTHFGRQMLQAGPRREAAKVQMSTGVRTIAAEDGMVLELTHEKNLIIAPGQKVKKDVTKGLEQFLQ